MAIDLNKLEPPFKSKVDQLLANCKQAGYPMAPNYAIRTPLEQAKLWRQSRTTAVITQEIQNLRAQGADYLADCIVNAGPQQGAQVTNAIPGLSWHQWGEALDCVWLVNGNENWSLTLLVNGKNGFSVYADEAQKLGLTAGGHWTTLKDWPHVQFRASNSPLSVYNLKQINDIMKTRFEAPATTV
jgi:LAS superfamily LD-carboxypeptidase LdcB